MSNQRGQTRIARLRRRDRVRKKIIGTAEVPRLSVYRSLNHIYSQVVDDVSGKTIVSASSLKIELPPVEEPSADDSQQKDKKGKKKAKPASTKFRRSIAVGDLIARLAKEKGIERVVFDRSGFLYHGRIAALAEAARKGGLKF